MTSVLLWALIVIYAIARVAQAFPDQIPVTAIVASHVLPPLLFALLHGAIRYRPLGIFVFAALCFVIGNLTENLGVLTGFPFGHYHFTDVMGPKLFQVPILLGLAYIGMGYLSWTLGGIIVGRNTHRLVVVPLVASFVMVAWDLSMDPVWSNFVHGWVWHDGGAWFGVPLSNFCGWYVTVYMIYQAFALYLQKSPPIVSHLPNRYWRMAVIFYGVSAAGNLFVIGPPGLHEVTDAAGTVWRVRDILRASDLVSIFIMGTFTVLAWVRLAKRVH